RHPGDADGVGGAGRQRRGGGRLRGGLPRRRRRRLPRPAVRRLRAVEPPARRGRPGGRPRQRPGSGAGLLTAPATAQSAVISLILAAISAAAGSGVPCCIAISLVMSPCTLILPAMKACMPACGLPSTRIALAVA